ELLDVAGKTVATIEMENLAPGRQAITPDEADLEPGSHSYKVNAIGTKREPVDSETYAVGRVDGTSCHGGQVGLRINGVLVPMLDIVEVLAAGPAAVGSTTTEESTQQ